MAVVSRRAAPQRSTSGLGTGTNEREPPDHQTDRADVRHGRWPPTSQQAKAHSRHPYLRGQHEIAGGERPLSGTRRSEESVPARLASRCRSSPPRRRFRTPSIGSIGSRWHVNRTKPSPVAADADSARAQTALRQPHNGPSQSAGEGAHAGRLVEHRHRLTWPRPATGWASASSAECKCNDRRTDSGHSGRSGTLYCQPGVGATRLGRQRDPGSAGTRNWPDRASHAGRRTAAPAPH